MLNVNIYAEYCSRLRATQSSRRTIELALQFRDLSIMSPKLNVRLTIGCEELQRACAAEHLQRRDPGLGEEERKAGRPGLAQHYACRGSRSFTQTICALATLLE